MSLSRLEQQMAFLVEADKLKSIDRSNVLMDLSRPENVGEHSWHLCLYAMTHANDAPEGADILRVITMLLLHDLVEIDAGDMPVWQSHDAAQHAQTEHAAAQRIFGLLPDDQGQYFYDLWIEFEDRQTPDAIFAKQLDHLQPIIQVSDAPVMKPAHIPIAHHTLTEGRAKRLAHEWPEAFDYALNRILRNELKPSDFTQRKLFLSEADRLKNVTRATTLCDASRYENSAEHSWHLALYALVLAEHAEDSVDLLRLIEMLILHDLVEIDAGDVPVFGDGNADQQAQDEIRAAERIFGLLPEPIGQRFFDIWTEFEAIETPEARFAKSLDRLQPPMQNLMSDGVSWRDFNVTLDVFHARVAPKIASGAPTLWKWLSPQVEEWFVVNVTSPEN